MIAPISGAQQELKEQVCISGVRRVHRNKAGVHAKAHRALGEGDLQIRVALKRQCGKRRERIDDGHVAGEQIVVQVLILQHVNVGRQRIELLRGRGEHRLVGSIHALAHGEKHHAEGHARIVNQADTVRQRRIPQAFKPRDLDIDRRRIVYNQRRAAT